MRDRTVAVMAGFPGAVALDPNRPEKVLLVIGERFLALARGDALGALRAVHGVAGAQPEVCRALYKEGPGRVMEELAAYLRLANSAGTLKVRNPLQAADLFLSMFLGSGHIRGMLKLEMPYTQENKALYERLFGSSWRPTARKFPANSREQISCWLLPLGFGWSVFSAIAGGDSVARENDEAIPVRKSRAASLKRVGHARFMPRKVHVASARGFQEHTHRT